MKIKMSENSQNMSKLQQEVLSKYSQLAESLHRLDTTVKQLNQSARETKENSNNVSAEEILEEMRQIETKIGLIGTLFKGSVYSFILQRKNEFNLMNNSSSIHTSNNNNNQNNIINKGDNDNR